MNALADLTALSSWDRPYGPPLEIHVGSERAVAGCQDSAPKLSRGHVPLGSQPLMASADPLGFLHGFIVANTDVALGVANSQRPSPHHRGMDEELDDAIETAVERAREAQERFREKSINSPEIVQEARVVEDRTDDIHVLAEDASTEAGRA